MAVEMKSIRPIGDEETGLPPAYDNRGYQRDAVVPITDVEDVTPNDVKVDVEKHDNGITSYPPYTTSTDGNYNAYERTLISIHVGLDTKWRRHKAVIKLAVGVILGLLYFAYFGYAMYYRFGDEGSWRLLVCTVLTVMLIAIVMTYGQFHVQINRWWGGTQHTRESRACMHMRTFIKWFLRVGVFVTIVVYVIVDIAIDHPQNLISVAGLALYIIIFYLTSVNPAKINWHTVFWGMALQYVFALLILRTQWGYDIFRWLGDRVTEFMEHTTKGVIFLYGEGYAEHFFAFKVLSIVVFFFTFINIMYYLGVMQAVVRVMGRALAFCMGTTPAESINAAANIFVSMTESPLLIRPFLNDMTMSELHAVMTGGFATIAGSVLGAYISFGVPANHLLSASVMSAPAALAISKLSYPETETTKASSKDFDKIQKSPERNLMEAGSNGATASIKIVGAIAVNVLAFLSLLAFLNATLTWFGNRVGIDNFTFEYICSYVLYPVSYFMGTDTTDCRKVAELVGVKTFTNEFIAYGQLKDLIANRKALTNYTMFFNTTDWFYNGSDIVLNITGEVLKEGVLLPKSEVIATYALCGFANFGSIGITLGGLGGLAPKRKQDLTKMVMRAMICGNVACFLTACIAGLLYKDYD